MKQYAVKNDSALYTNTGLIGYLTISYNELFQEFGKANDYSTKTSTDILWILHGTVKGKLIIATVYVYNERQPKETITKWHIGGHNAEAMRLIQEIFPEKRIQDFYESFGKVEN